MKLLQTAAEIAGGNEALADRLGIRRSMLERLMADRQPLPDALLLRAVDIILEDRQSRPASGQSGFLLTGKSLHDGYGA